MNDYLLDANYLLRFVLKDNLKQAQIVRDLFHQAKAGDITIYAPLLVFVESVFILKKLYKFGKKEIAENLKYIIDLSFLDIEKRLIIIDGLVLYTNYNISFVDALFVTEAKQSGKQLLTFDKKLKKLA